MRRFKALPPLIPWLLFASMATAAGIDLGEKYKPYEPIVATVENEATFYLWDWGDTFELIEVGNGQTVHIWAPPGKHKIKCTLLTIDWDARTGTKEYLRATFVVQEGDDPVPPPPPPPPPPVELTDVLVVYEREQQTAQQAVVLTGLRQYLQQTKLHWRLADKDLKDGSTGKTPSWFTPYLAAVSKSKLKLPALVFGATNPDGRFSLVGVEALPATISAAVGLVKKYGG